MFITTQLNWTQLTQLSSVQPSQSCFCLWRHDLQTESSGSLRSLICDSCSRCERVDYSTSSWVCELCRYKRALTMDDAIAFRQQLSTTLFEAYERDSAVNYLVQTWTVNSSFMRHLTSWSVPFWHVLLDWPQGPLSLHAERGLNLPGWRPGNNTHRVDSFQQTIGISELLTLVRKFQ